MSQFPTQTPAERAGWFMMLTGIMCAVLLGLNLLPALTITPEQFLQAYEESSKQNPMAMGQPLPIGPRGALIFLSIWSVVVSGLIIAAVTLAVSGYRLRRGERRSLRSGAIAVGFLLFAFVGVGLLGLIALLLAPATALVALLLAGPALLLGWVIALMVKARDSLPAEPTIDHLRPATFHVPLSPGELPEPG